MEIFLMQWCDGEGQIRREASPGLGIAASDGQSCNSLLGFRPRSQIPLYSPGFHAAELRGVRAAAAIAGSLKT